MEWLDESGRTIDSMKSRFGVYSPLRQRSIDVRRSIRCLEIDLSMGCVVHQSLPSLIGPGDVPPLEDDRARRRVLAARIRRVSGRCRLQSQ